MTDDPKKHVCPHDVPWCGDMGSLCRMCREDRADKRAQILADAVGDAVAHRNIAEALEEPVDETGWPALTTDAEPKSLPRRRPHVPPVDPLFRDDAPAHSVVPVEALEELRLHWQRHPETARRADEHLADVITAHRMTVQGVDCAWP